MPFFTYQTKAKQNGHPKRNVSVCGCAALFHGEGWSLPINTPGVTIRG